MLLPPDELNRVWVLRKVLSPLSTVEAMELLAQPPHENEVQRRISRFDVRADLEQANLDHSLRTFIKRNGAAGIHAAPFFFSSGLQD